jgi:ankyrin repeat protein
LHVAAAAGNAELVCFLLSVGASQEIRDSLGRTAADVAIINGHQRVASCISCT